MKTLHRLSSAAARAAILALALVCAGCGAPSTSGTASAPIPSSGGRHVLDLAGGGPARMSAALYDAPLRTAGETHVYLAIAGLDVVADGVASTVVAYATPQTVDLLALKHTPYTLQGDLPVGSYDAVRLLVDTAHSYVRVDGKVYPMIFTRHAGRKKSRPAIAGIDAKIPIAGVAGQPVNVAVDFNALESISLHGGYAYVKPKLVAAKESAQVHGTVVNASGGPVRGATVVVYDKDGRVANSTVTEADGSFVVHALDAGSYTLTVVNAYVTDSGEAVVAEGATSGIGPSVHVTLAPSDDLSLPPLYD